MENGESLTSIPVTFNFLVTNSLDNISVYSVYGLSHIMTVKQKSGTNCLTSIRVTTLERVKQTKLGSMPLSLVIESSCIDIT